MTDLNITARQFKRLVSPVLPCAGTDDMLPVLNAIHVRSQGAYLVARATDRFRLGVQRLKAPEGNWPEWEALLPLSTVKAILNDFKPSRQDADPQLVLRLDGDTLRVKADAALLDMLSADITYPLREGQFPKTDKLLRDALAAEPEPGAHAGFNWKFLASFTASVGDAVTMGIKITSPSKPAVIANGEDFVGILMPRRLIGADVQPGFTVGEDWDAILADRPEAKPEATTPKKRTTKKTATPARAAS